MEPQCWLAVVMFSCVVGLIGIVIGHCGGKGERRARRRFTQEWR